jgi:hypothetical protein
MRMARCPRCSLSLIVFEGVRCCPNCGTRLAVKRRKGLSPEAIALAIFLIMSAGFVAAAFLFPSLLGSTSRPSHRYRVVYRITGSTTAADLAYLNAADIFAQVEVNRTETHTFDSPPWEYVHYADYGDYMYISARNEEDHGTITCEILVDDEVVEKATARGAYGVAACGGSAGK